MKKLNKANYQTVIIEMAIEELTKAQIGKRTQIDDFDVRHTLDNLREKTWVTTGWKQDPENPEKNIPIQKQAADIWQYSEATIQTILAKVRENQSKDKTKFKFETKEMTGPILKSIIKDLKTSAFFIKAEHVPNFVKSVLVTARYTQTMNKEADGEDNQKLHILYSPVQGGGKSRFLHRMQEAAEEAGVISGFGVLSERNDTNAILDPFIENALTFIDDIKQLPSKDILMAVGRKGEIDVRKKYAKPYIAVCNSEVWGASNMNFSSDRTVDLIECNSYDIKAIKERIEGKIEWKLSDTQHVSLCNIYKYTFTQSTQWTQYKNLLEDIFCKNNFNAKIEGNLSVQETTTELSILPEIVKVPNITYLLEYLQLVKPTAIEYTKVSVAKITKNADVPKADVLKVRSKLSRILKKLYSQGLIRRTQNGSVDWEQYDVTDLMDITPEMVGTYGESNSEATILDDFKATQAAYDACIKAVDLVFPPFLGGSDEKLDDSWTVCNVTDTEGNYNINGDQVCVNKPLEGEPKNRKNKRVHQQNFLFECDPPEEIERDTKLLKVNLKEQIARIENAPQKLKDSLLWTCFTGGKSIHVIVHTNLKDEDMWTEKGEYDPGLRKYIHQKLNEEYFSGLADPSGQNAGRLARAPNAIRQDNKHPGEKQLCLQFNMNAKPLDVSTLVETYREEQKLRNSLREITQKVIPEECRKEPSIHTLRDLKIWNQNKPSKAKQECIEFLEGRLQDWNRSLACVRNLRYFGFTDYEIEFEGPANDTWIGSALKKAH